MERDGGALLLLFGFGTAWDGGASPVFLAVSTPRTGAFAGGALAVLLVLTLLLVRGGTTGTSPFFT